MRTLLQLLILISSILLSTSLESYAQSITWGPTSPPGVANDLHVYSINSSATFEFTNGATPLTSPTIQVDLGVGVEYVAGSFTFTASGSGMVTENSATGDNPALFNISSLALGETVSITFERQANCDARDHKSGGGTFADICHVYENGMEVTYANNGGDPFAANYDVVFSNLVLGTVTHSPGSSTAVGGTVTRSLSITNGRFGSVDEFWYQDIYLAGDLTMSNFQINGVSIPAANLTNIAGSLSIYFDPALILLINGSNGTNGDADGFFEKDEFFILSYDVSPLNCGNNNVLPSDLKVYYGASETMECSPSGESATSITITNGTPQVAINTVVNPGVDFCGSTTHSLTITNNGTDLDDFAKDVIFFIGLRSNNSPISSHNNVTMWGSTYRNTKNFSNVTIGGNPIPASQIAGLYGTQVDYIPPNLFTSNVDGPGGLDDLDGDGFFDDLGPGQSVTVGFDMTLTPRDQTCGSGRVDYIFWEHISMDIAWLNQCGSLQTPIRREFNYTNFIRNYSSSTFLSGPADISSGENFEVAIKPHLYNTIKCNGGSGTTGSDVEWTVKVVLPPGVSLQSGATTDLANATFSPTIYQSNDTVYYTISRYRYDWFTFPLTLDCMSWDGTAPLPFNFITTYDCDGCFTEDLHCETVYAAPHCPQACTGVTTDGFEAKRTTPGWTDATMTTPVTLTEGTHGLDQVLPFDTIQLVARGHISDTTSDNLHLRISYSPDSGVDIFDFINGEITIYDIDGAFGNVVNTFPLSSPPIVNSLGSGSFEWLIDLTAYLGMIDNMYLLEDVMVADSFKVTLYTVFNQNPGISYFTVNNFRANFFMYDDVPIERSCDSYGTSMNYTGFSSSTSAAQITLQGCEQKTARAYATWQNYSGDVFPNEYRPIQRIDSIIWDIPAGINVLNVTPNGLNGTLNYYTNSSGQIVAIPNNDYTPADWRTTYYPGYQLTINGSCETPSGLNTGNVYIHRTFYNYHPNTDLHQTTLNTSNGNPKITYIKPDLVLTPLGQIQPGVTDTVKWDIEVCNGTSGLNATYTWVTFDEASSDGITLIDIFDVTNGTEVAITSTNLGSTLEMIPLQNLDGGDCKTIRMVATYSSCSADSLSLDLGWDCVDYPTNLTDLNQCGISSFVSVSPLEAQMAATLTNLFDTPNNPSLPGAGTYNENTIEMCEPFPVEFTIVSSGAGTIYDINFDISIPGLGAGLEYIPNSATIEVEGIDATNMPRSVDVAGEASFASGSGAIWNIDLADLDNTNFSSGAGLNGAGNNANQNEVIIRWTMKSTCDFTSGDKIEIQSYSNAACTGQALGSGETSIGTNLNVDGIVLPYAALLTTSISPTGNFEGCATTKMLSIESLISGGTTGSTDSLFITLPEGLAFSGTQTCTSTYCPTFAGTKYSQGKQVILYQYPPAISNQTFQINVELLPDVNAPCSTSTIEVKSTVNVGGISCGMSVCPSVKVVTGVKDEQVTFDKANITLDFTKITIDPNTGVYNYEIDAVNNGIQSDGPLSIDVYCLDNASNPILTGGSIGTISTPQISAGQSTSVTGTLPANSCIPANGLVAVLDTLTDNGLYNCICNAAESKYTNITEVLQPGIVATNQTICPSADPVEFTVSVSASGGAGTLTYQWQESTNCTGTWSAINGATNSTYDPPPLSQTTCYQRTVTEPCGAVAISNIITVTVSDTQNPVISCPSNINQNTAPGVCSALITFSVTSTDNCPGEVTTQTTGFPSGSQFPVGTTTNTFLVTDLIGNTATCSFDVTITDMEDPEITCPTSINQGVDLGICGAIITYQVNSEDNCLGQVVTQTAGIASDSLFPIGTTTNSFLVSDLEGNTATCSFSVTIYDDESPVANCPQTVVQPVSAGSCNAIVNYQIPTFDDNCDGTGLFGTQVGGPLSGTVFPLGTSTITVHYTDQAGNGPVVCTFDVEVTDEIPPTANCQNVSLALNTNGDVSISPANINNNSTDNCSVASMTLSQTTFDCTNAGSNTVILTVSDASGNTATCAANVEIDATPIPDFTCPTPTLNNCDGNFALNFTDLNLATLNIVSATLSGSAAPYVVGDFSPGENAYLDPTNMPLNVPLTLIYTLNIGTCSTSSVGCTFTIAKSGQSEAGGFLRQKRYFSTHLAEILAIKLMLFKFQFSCQNYYIYLPHR